MDAFLQSVVKLVELHHLIQLDKDDSPEGDAIRDACDPLWHECTQKQREVLQTISAKIYEAYNDDEEVPGHAPAHKRDDDNAADVLG